MVKQFIGMFKMIDTKYYIIFILILLVGLVYYIQEERISNRNALIASIQLSGDTLYVTGDIDTVFRTKVVKEVKTVYLTQSNEKFKIDSTIVVDSSRVRIFTDDIFGKGLEVAIEIKCKEIEIIRIDTLKIPYPVLVEVAGKCKTYENIGYGFLSGIVVMILTILAVNSETIN